MTAVRDKRVIVTGRANEIGFRYCHHLLSNGAKVVAMFDLPETDGGTSAKKLNEEFGNGRAIFFPSDVTKHEEFEGQTRAYDFIPKNLSHYSATVVLPIFLVEDLKQISTKVIERTGVFQKAVKALGGLDILVNHAGILNDELWEKEIQVNFTSLVKSTLLGYETMGKHRGGNGGVIVNVASAAGLVPLGYIPVYSATKAAVITFTVSLKSHYEKTGISVRVICPSATDLPMKPALENNFLNFIDQDHAFKNLSGLPRQPADHVAKAIVQLIEKGTNGSVWVSQLGEPPVDVQLAEYKTVKL